MTQIKLPLKKEKFKLEIINILNEVLKEEIIHDTLQNTLLYVNTKYGNKCLYKLKDLITNEIIAHRYEYRTGVDKNALDNLYFSKRMELYRKVQRHKQEGKTAEEVTAIISHLAAKSYITTIYSQTEEQFITMVREAYKNQELGKTPIKVEESIKDDIPLIES